MGANCLGCSAPHRKKPKYSIEPDDTSDFNPQKLNHRLRKLNFKGQVDNVEIVNYPYDIISINFNISDFFECSLPRQRRNNYEKVRQTNNELGQPNKIKWKLCSSFEIKMDEYQLRKTFITISIFNDSPSPLLEEKLNLYQIITGPYHHDIALHFQNKVTSRLLFDFKISQKFFILINPLEVSVLLNQQYPGQEFNYSFNSYACGQKISSSDGSLPQKVNIFSSVEGSYRQLKPEDQCQSPTRIRKGTNLNKMIKNTMMSSLKWLKPKTVVLKSALKDTEDTLEQEIIMPSFNFQLSSNQINKSYLQFILWNIEFNKSLCNNQAILFSDCYIPFPKMFETDYLCVEELEMSQKDSDSSKKVLKKLENRICILEESLIKDGKSIGKLIVKLNLINQSFFSQLSLHARTQDGIIYMNSMFKNYIGKQAKNLPTESIMKIESSFERITQFFLKIAHLKGEKKRNWTQYNRMEEKVLEQFSVLNTLLQCSIEQSLILVRKHNVQEIIEKQNVFLGILQRIMIFLQEQSSKFVVEIWKVILLIMKRGQFYLQNIGFGQFDSNSPTNNANGQKSNDTSEPNTSVIYPKKMRTAVRYQQILYKILINSLGYNYESQRDTIIEAEAFKPYGYFRVPKFREEVLKCIMKSEIEMEISQQTIDILKEESKVSKMVSKFEQKTSAHLDWEKYFYFNLKNEKKSHSLDVLLVSSFKNNQWFQSIAQRKESFYIFIEYFTKKMAELGKRLKIIQYSYCPGYNKLVRSFLIEMKKKPLLEYESCMIETSTALLVNHNLINIIIPLVVQKTNLYDSASLNQFLNIFSNYFKFLTENGTKTIPQKFNHTYFFKIIKIILESDYSCAISKILVILHTYFECFNDQFKDVLCLYLLSKAFFRLFFHWSFSIRIIFYHLFIIKIYWSKLNGVTQKHNHMDTYRNENCQIYSRYKKLIKILNAAERQKTIKKKNMKRAQKQEYYMKMKRKISNRFKQNPQAVKMSKQNESGFDSSSEHSNQKEETLNLARLHTLCELKDGYNRSETLCSTEIKEHLRKIQSERMDSNSTTQNRNTSRNMSPQQETQEQSVDHFGINLKVVRKRKDSNISKKVSKDNFSENNLQSQTSVKEEIQKLNEEYIKKLSLVNHKVSSSEEKPLVYTFFGNDDYELEELSLNQENKVLLGMEEFRETQDFVEKYILQKGVAPHVNLDPEIQLDSNEFKLIEISTL